MNGITSDHITGFAMGIGVAAVGFYLYKKNQTAIDGWLQSQGINVPNSVARDYSALSLQELVAEKERLEDLIAEREYVALSPSEGAEAANA
jgi:hypothetical protein